MGDLGDGAPLKKVNSYQWPTGHVGHLTDGQVAALGKFKKLSQDKGYYVPGDEKNAPTHDDETLLRYLRARKFIPREAFTQFKDTEDWRKETNLGQLYENIDVEEYDEVRRLYPQWTGRRDKRGIPLYVFEIGSVDSKDVDKSGKDKKKQAPKNTKTPWKMLKLFALYENLCRFVLPMCSAIPNRPNPESPISQSNNIVDLSGVGIAKLWKLRGHMGDASRLATAYYPETLDRIFVIGAPNYFETIWSWAQGWFDPITVAKIFILTQKNTLSTLEKFVDRENIPKKYGGDLDWNFGQTPNLEPAIADSMIWKEKVENQGHRTLPIGPMIWQYDENGDLVMLAVGSDQGAKRNRVIASLHPDVDTARLALSPGRVDSVQTPHPLSAQKSDNNLQFTNGSVATPKTATPRMSSDADLNVGKDPRAHVSDTSRSGHYTVPADPDDRQGTSSTRYQQQEGTHAQGQLADGTPATRYDSQGEKAAIIDPHTVGQAPKEHPLPIPEEPQPSVIDQAKDMAGQAMEQAKELPSTVMSAVGMGEKKADEPVEERDTRQDPQVDAMSGKDVEEFLRARNQSKPGQ